MAELTYGDAVIRAISQQPHTGLHVITLGTIAIVLMLKSTALALGLWRRPQYSFLPVQRRIRLGFSDPVNFQTVHRICGVSPK